MKPVCCHMLHHIFTCVCASLATIGCVIAPFGSPFPPPFFHTFVVLQLFKVTVPNLCYCALVFLIKLLVSLLTMIK